MSQCSVAHSRRTLPMEEMLFGARVVGQICQGFFLVNTSLSSSRSPKLSYSHSNTLSALFGNGERYKDCPIQNLRGVSHSFCKFKFPALHRTGVTVSYIYLLQSPLSRSPLQPGHFAHRIPGTSTSSQALRRPFSQCPLH